MLLVCGVLIAAVAEAQGRGGAPPGLQKKRTFGGWLDDATMAAPRSVWVTVAATRWTSPIGDGTDVPVVGVAAGLSPRAQFSLSVSRSRFTLSDDGAETTSGFGNLYAGVKFLAVERAGGGVGVSFSPTLEVLNEATAAAAGLRRVHGILPLSIEAGQGAARFYGSVGYFTRGATFASAALELHLAPRVAATAAVMQSWAVRSATVTDNALDLGRRRTDVSGGVTVFVAPAAAVFASLGRTVSRMDFDSTRVVFTAGLSLGLSPPAEMPPRPPR
jgi:hypothetical protein